MTGVIRKEAARLQEKDREMGRWSNREANRSRVNTGLNLDDTLTHKPITRNRMIPKKNQVPPDIIVVGGGAAGMMAAGRAAERGAKVILVEKTHRLGNKLLLTGGGRCNITHQADLREFIHAFG